MKILHIITGLDIGGAEIMLHKLLFAMKHTEFVNEVISLTDIGPVGQKIETFGVQVRTLGMRRGLPNPLLVPKLVGWLGKFKPDVIQTWMYHADLIGGFAAKLAGKIPVVWGIRHGDLDPEGNKRTTIWTAKVCARFSRWLPVKIVCLSEASRRIHTDFGYDSDRMAVIPNGFDLNIFKPDLKARALIRQELDIAQDVIVIGMVARFDPQKDHLNLIKAASLLQKEVSDVQFLLCGEGVTWENQKLSGWIDEAGLRKNFLLIGKRNDIPRIMSALDIASSSSYSEGFSNFVGEAMACGVPCVVTDVADLAFLVGDTGFVVPPKDPEALAMACLEIVKMGDKKRRSFGQKAQERIEENFSISSIAERYVKLYKEVLYNYADSTRKSI